MRHVNNRQVKVGEDIDLDTPDSVESEKKYTGYKNQDSDGFTKCKFYESHLNVFQQMSSLKVIDEQVKIAGGGSFE